MNEAVASPATFLELGGTSRKLEYTMHSIAQIRKLTGKNPLKGEIEFSDPEHMTALVWGGLITGDASLDGIVSEGKGDDKVQGALDQVSKWIRIDQFDVISKAIARAFNVATDSGEKAKK